jgi:type IV fimbrial biogenesis protein FimT
MKVSAGFSLIELVSVILIATILMTLGVPSYRAFTSSNRMSAEINGLLGDMQFARSEAIREGRTVTVCSSADGATCSGSSNWSTGRIVFSDPTNVGVVDPTETKLRVQAKLQSGDTLTDTSGTVPAATFNRAGLLSIAALPAAGITMSLHDSRDTAAFTRCLWIGSLGLVTTQTPATAAGCR